MEIEFHSHFSHGLCRVQDIAIGDLCPMGGCLVAAGLTLEDW